MKTKILLSLVVTLSVSGIALSDSLLPESTDNANEIVIKAINNNVSLLQKQAQIRFGAATNDVDKLRLQQVNVHLETADKYKESRVFTLANRELDYANSLLQLPKSEFSIGHL